MKNVACFLLLFLGLSGCGDDTPTAVPDLTGQVVYLAANGFNTNPGTATAPVATMDRAMELARQGQGVTIKAALGTYRSVGNQYWDFTGGVDIIGGCNRTTWEPEPGGTSEIQIIRRPIKALDIRVPTRVSGLYLDQIFEGDPSSNALYLSGCSEDLVFSGCHFSAARGADGDPGQSGRDGDLVEAQANGKPGDSGTCTGVVFADGGEGGYYQCSGGRGGSGGLPGQAGSDGQSGSCNGADGGQGGEVGSDGLPGLDGLMGENGENGGIPLEMGYFLGSSYLPLDSEHGRSGSDGMPGGGGGGGGGSVSGTGNGGGGGGSAGEAGWEGRGGEGGGHSIAVICVNSASIFQNCLFTGEGGGNGGAGGHGGAGAAGGIGGEGETACPGEVGSGGRGGAGGTGGSGGGGGGGNGGACIGIFLSGNARPMIETNCQYQLGDPGAAGAGGQVGDGSGQAPSGMPGLAVTILDQVDTAGKIDGRLP